MPRLIALFVAAYWMAFFCLLALAALGEVEGDGLLVLGPRDAGSEAAGLAAGSPFSMVLAVALLVVAALFLWTLVTTILQRGDPRGEGDDVFGIAFAAAAAMMAVLLLAGTLEGVDGIFASASLQLLALLVSYVAIEAERRRMAHRDHDEMTQTEATARVMALGAAQDSLLSRLSGRDPGSPRRF